MNEIDIHNYLKLFGVHNEKVINEEKEIIDTFINTVKKRKIDINNEKDYGFLYYTLKRLFDLEMSLYKSDDVSFELSDDDSYLGNFEYKIMKNINNEYVLRDLKICVSKDSLTMEYLNDSINERIFGANQILKALFHEIEHYKQLKKLSSNISNIQNLRFAHEFIISDEKLINDINPKGSYLYSINHNSFSIENDANNKAFEKLAIILDTNAIANIKDCNVHKLDMLLSDIKEESESGFIYDREEYLDSKIDEIIKNNRYLLKRYPILLKEYTKYGNKKNLNELLYELFNEISDIQKLNLKDYDKYKIIKDTYDMYYELIFKRIKNNDKKEIKNVIDLIGYDNFINLTNNIKNHYKEDSIFKSNVSKRKYDLKCINDCENNYLKRTNINGTIRYNNELYSLVEYTKKYLNINCSTEIKKIIAKYVIPRIPDCGYFMLHNGSKILPNEFINNYLLKDLDKDMHLMDTINAMKKYVKSTRETIHLYELERINANYQIKTSTIDNVINEYNMNNKTSHRR